MGQYAGQVFFNGNHNAVKDVMEVLLDIALTVLGTLSKKYKPFAYITYIAAYILKQPYYQSIMSICKHCMQKDKEL